MCIIEEYTVSYPDVRRRRVLQRCLLGRSFGYCYRTQVVSPGERVPERPASQFQYAQPRTAHRPAMRSLRHLIVDPREQPARRRRSPSYPRRMPSRRSDPFRVFFPFLRRASDSDDVWKGDEYRPRGRGRSPRPVIVTPDVPPINREPRGIPRRRPLGSKIRVVSPPSEPLYKEEPMRPRRGMSPASPSLSPRNPGTIRHPVIIHQESKPRPSPIPSSSSSGYQFRNPWRNRSPSPGTSNWHRKGPRPSLSSSPGPPKPQEEPQPQLSPVGVPSTDAPAAPLTPPRKRERRPRERSPSIERVQVRKTRSSPTVPVEVHNPPAPDSSPKPVPASSTPSPGSGPRHVQFSDIVDHLSISGESNVPSSPTGPPRFYRQFGSASRRRSPTPGPTPRLGGGRGRSSSERIRYVYASPSASRSYPPGVEVLIVTPRRYRPEGITPPLSRATDICEVEPGRRSSSSGRAARGVLDGSGLRVEGRRRRGMGREELGRSARPRIISLSPPRGRWRPRVGGTERYGGFESGDGRAVRDQGGSARVWRWL
ncbi:hypothetical protein BDQ94DRAFT_96195 [Aspergillus welwitschiae]|uniref:Uncharacterized protein n=1 Tax=Aspergillus welwitschiae TaxID=1341132 RepID=A0A3F3PP73_9EURO|nr:hypothetical protein BDQ94DRAFT_96195 [Aspergillus welwitschiae]RDH28699.1 hypothetical protein BDQ94DRAFT_96195 [Aspergillus welwitschiae]